MVAKYLKITNLSYLFPQGVPGEDSYYGFMKRNPFLHLKGAEPKEVSRKIQEVDPFVIFDFGEKLEKLLFSFFIQYRSRNAIC